MDFILIGDTLIRRDAITAIAATTNGTNVYTNGGVFYTNESAETVLAAVQSDT